MIRHDRDPRFMGRVFKPFREMLGSRQERSMKTVIRSGKAYVQTVDQSDWDELPEKLMWALNTSFDFTRLDTPFYLVHGWDAQDRLKEGFEVGISVWLYLARIRPGLTKKLAHPWHGPFRIREKDSDFRYRLLFEDIPEDDDFDAALLREDSWGPDEGYGEYEVEVILDVRWVTRTRTSRRVKEYLVKWKGYEAPDWIPQECLNCGRLLYEFDQGVRARARFQTIQSGDELLDEEVR
ncbi:reverse transcriptase [Phytophthora megakarya]|uniref:Reverse transcriptase n=1 Tax=Phytophthora megakarya TaxID=4795 RepID=A0A225VJ61_9STRA|nr:reverse transcriptase [Phytophthora megakarya]